VLHHHGALDKAELSKHVPLPEPLLTELLERLVSERRIRASERDGAMRYEHDSILIGYGDREGWQGALLDHYQAIVIAMCTKLRLGPTHAQANDAIGGSTYHFDIWPGHPLEHEVIGLLARLRAESLQLCERVLSHNATVDAPPRTTRVTAYLGQSLHNHGARGPSPRTAPQRTAARASS
jgi:hypothetical protein